MTWQIWTLTASSTKYEVHSQNNALDFVSLYIWDETCVDRESFFSKLAIVNNLSNLLHLHIIQCKYSKVFWILLKIFLWKWQKKYKFSAKGLEDFLFFFAAWVWRFYWIRKWKSSACELLTIQTLWRLISLNLSVCRMSLNHLI